MQTNNVRLLNLVLRECYIFVECKDKKFQSELWVSNESAFNPCAPVQIHTI